MDLFDYRKKMTTNGGNSWIWIDNAVNFILFAY